MNRLFDRPPQIALVAIVALLCTFAAAPATAGSLDAQITWLEGKPSLSLSIDATPPEAVKEIILPVTLFDATGKPLFTYPAKIPVTAKGPFSVQVPLDKVADPKKQHRIDVNYSSPE